MDRAIPRVLIAGTHSGVGKTSVAVGLMAALRRSGSAVQPFKVGPDYLDPGFHTAACGRPSWPLDSWMLGCAGVRESFARGTGEADIAIIEGMMGLYDGASATGNTGSTAEVAQLLDCPVILVIDAAGMARSAGALVQGFRDFDPGIRLAGVIANRVAGKGHLDYLRPSVEALGVPLLGGLPPDESIRMPERHLGLASAGELQDTSPLVARLADWVASGLDLARIREMAEAAPEHPVALPINTRAPASGVRIGVARDAAFCFYYPDNLALLEALGAELVSFSPIANESLPPGIHGIYLGGGYPELHAADLAANTAMRTDMKRSIQAGLPTFAECGGFMYLCEELIGSDGGKHPMVGIVPGRVRMEEKLQAIGYREVTLFQDSALGRAGTRARGHEFRYSRYEGEIPPGSTGLAVGEGGTGFATESLLASYVHLHFGSNPSLAEHFVERCRQRR